MSKEALLEFKKYVEEEEFTSEFKEERLKRIDSILVGRNQANSRREAKEDYLTGLAYEYVDLTDNWIKLGATFREWHPFTTWEYQGTDFFQWTSGERSEQILPRAREANEKLKDLIKDSTQWRVAFFNTTKGVMENSKFNTETKEVRWWVHHHWQCLSIGIERWI